MFQYPSFCNPCCSCRKNTGNQHNVRLTCQPVNAHARRNVIAKGGNPNEYTINGTNCYLVGRGTSRILVDCAEQYLGNEEFMRNLSNAMKKTGTKSLCAIIITHLHHDHYGGIYSVQKEYGPGIPVYKSEVPDHWWDTLNGIRKNNLMHRFVREDGTLRFHPKRDLTQSGDNVGDPRSTQNSDAFHSKPPRVDTPEFNFLTEDLGYDKNQVRSLPFMFSFMFDAYNFMNDLYTGRLIWRKLERGTKITTPDGSATLVCVPTPGHSPDHCGFKLLEENSLLSGDHVLGQGTTVVQDMYAYMNSLDEMIALRPTRLYPGHGCYVADGLDLLERYIKHRLERENQVWDLLCEKTSTLLSAPSIANILYTSTPKERLHLAAENVYKICSSLFRKGLLSAKIMDSKEEIWIELKPTDLGPFDRVRPYLVRDVHWKVLKSLRTKL